VHPRSSAAHRGKTLQQNTIKSKMTMLRHKARVKVSFIPKGWMDDCLFTDDASMAVVITCQMEWTDNPAGHLLNKRKTYYSLRQLDQLHPGEEALRYKDMWTLETILDAMVINNLPHPSQKPNLSQLLILNYCSSHTASHTWCTWLFLSHTHTHTHTHKKKKKLV
jgi:hypothetical protein